MTTNFSYVKELFEKNINNNDKYLVSYDNPIYTYFIYDKLIILSHKFIDEFIIFYTNNKLNKFKFYNIIDLNKFLKEHIDITIINELN